MRLIKIQSLHMLLLFSAILAGSSLWSCKSTQTVAQREQKALRIKEKVESHVFTFNAESAYPMGYKSIHLTSSYDLKVSKDTVQAFLPFFGRAYTAPLDPTEGGFKFTSTDFAYRFVDGKKPGNWKVTIKATSSGRNYTLSLDIWDNGTAWLVVNDPDKQSISFEGYIVDQEN